MRKTNSCRKLELHRETLQKLAEGDLEHAAGGIRKPSVNNTICDACTSALQPEELPFTG